MWWFEFAMWHMGFYFGECLGIVSACPFSAPF